MEKVAIIGAGACGMLLANLLADSYQVTLFEKNNKLAKKVLASGNGKCNFTNIGDYINKYNNEFAEVIISKFDNNYLRAYLSKLGLAYRVDNENRAYPLSENSVSLVDVLKKGLKDVKIRLDTRVDKIESANDMVKIYHNNTVESFDYIVCASGSSASNLGSEYAYNYLKDYDVKFSPLNPSLVPIIVKENVKSLSGIRVKCKVNLYKNNEFIYSENGEVLFKDNGLSGIVIYNISSVINRDINAKYLINLDLLSDSYERINNDDLLGVVHPKIASYLKENSINIHEINFNFMSFEDVKLAQVISGGVSLIEVNHDLSLKKDSRIYVGGELLDCDGMCGGFNLQFAFSCAFLINESIRNNKIIQ